ncbi:MAG: HNH endonuclease [Blastocatellia bacterium]
MAVYSITVDHVFPTSLGGMNTFDNLALACFHCNRRESTLRMALDGQGGRVVPLFNPRKHRWRDHFIWSGNGLLIVPLTPTGRVTVKEFDLNRERIQQIRAADVSVGRHPPFNDPVQPVG